MKNHTNLTSSIVEIFKICFVRFFFDEHEKIEKKNKAKCLICGKSFSTTIYKGGKYSNGHYFCTLKIPVEGTGEYKKRGTTRIARKKFGVVKWAGEKREVDYWECNECFEEAGHEYWLEEKIEKLFGKRCPDYEPSCCVCRAWGTYDAIREDSNEQTGPAKV